MDSRKEGLAMFANPMRREEITADLEDGFHELYESLAYTKDDARRLEERVSQILFGEGKEPQGPLCAKR
jgi:hypothetical protein